LRKDEDGANAEVAACRAMKEEATALCGAREALIAVCRPVCVKKTQRGTEQNGGIGSLFQFKRWNRESGSWDGHHDWDVDDV
jgi:hypothetical protein